MSDAPQRYPLDWPLGVPRTSSRKHDHFRGCTVAGAIIEILVELGRMGVHSGNVVISTNIETSLNGQPYSGRAPKNGDPGVVVYWRHRDQLHAMPLDQYSRVEANLHAVALSLAALRALERYGGKQVRDRAFGGFAALPAKAGASSWRAALGLPLEGLVDERDVEEAFRKAALAAHPDRGGTIEAMSRITEARADAIRELRS